MLFQNTFHILKLKNLKILHFYQKYQIIVRKRIKKIWKQRKTFNQFRQRSQIYYR